MLHVQFFRPALQCALEIWLRPIRICHLKTSHTFPTLFKTSHTFQNESHFSKTSHTSKTFQNLYTFGSSFRTGRLVHWDRIWVPTPDSLTLESYRFLIPNLFSRGFSVWFLVSIHSCFQFSFTQFGFQFSVPSRIKSVYTLREKNGRSKE